MTQDIFLHQLQKTPTGFSFNGDISQSKTPLQCNGNLKITGNVDSGVVLNVIGNIEILGSVYESEITASDTVTVHQSFLGAGKGKITARNVVINSINGQIVEAKDTITIAVEALSAELIAGNKIQSPSARIVGGTAKAGAEIIALTIGDSEAQLTKIYLGNRKKILQLLNALNKEEEQLKANLPKITDGIYKLSRLKIDQGTLHADQQLTLNKLRAMKEQIPHRLDQIKAEIPALQQQLKEKHEAKLIVYESIFENVMIDFNGIKEVLSETVHATQFHLGVDGLVRGAIK